MGSLHRLLFAALLVLAAAIDGAAADAMVTGTVFCDQCRDGRVSLFDFPISGAKVAVACGDSDGKATMTREETTNWMGSYSIRFEGTPDLSNCYAQVSGGGEDSMGCGAAAGPPQKLRLMFSMFDMEMYTADSLLSQPSQPMSFCPRSSPDPVPAPVTPAKAPPPFRLPPLPRLPPMPPMPFFEASACSHEKWTMPEYRCYWRAINPETKVAVVFGMEARRRYGSDMTLWQGLQGRGDPYRTLLREATTALLNSYNSLAFPYHTLVVLQRTDWALRGSNRSLLLTALKFRRANSGSGTVTCRFTPCKSS